MGEEGGKDRAVLPQSGDLPGKGGNVGATPEAIPARRPRPRLHSLRDTRDDGLRVHFSGW